MSEFSGIGTGELIQVALPGAPIFGQVDEDYDYEAASSQTDCGLVLGDKGTACLLVTGSLPEIRDDLLRALDFVETAMRHRPDLAGGHVASTFTMLDVSTVHLRPENRDHLNDVSGVIADRREFGWLMVVPSDDLEEQIKEYKVTEDIAAVWRLASRMRCSYVLFDDDADGVDGLGRYPDEN